MKREIIQLGEVAARSRRCGGALIEILFVLPLLLSLTFGVCEYSYFFFLKGSQVDSARYGARAAILPSATATSVQAAVKTSMSNAGFPSSAYTVTTNPSNLTGLPTGTQITVTVTSTWGTAGVSLLPTALGGISSSKTVIGTAVMNRE
jgi:Flp pilus assembly protein TadG